MQTSIDLRSYRNISFWCRRFGHMCLKHSQMSANDIRHHYNSGKAELIINGDSAERWRETWSEGRSKQFSILLWSPEDWFMSQRWANSPYTVSTFQDFCGKFYYLSLHTTNVEKCDYELVGEKTADSFFSRYIFPKLQNSRLRCVPKF